MPIALRAALGATLASLLLAAPAAAAVRSNNGTDDVGENGTAGYDIAQVAATLDDQSGAVTATVTLSGAAAGNAYVQADFTDFTGGQCSLDGAASIGGTRGGTTETKAVDGTAGTGSAVGGSGTTFQLSATVPSAASKTCVRFFTGPNGGQIADFTGYLPLDPPAAQPTPTPTPTPSPTVVAPTPTPAPAAPKPRLKLSIKGLKAVRAGKATRPTLTLRNAGTAPSKATTLRLKPPRGISVKPGAVKVKALAPGKAKTVKLRVAVSRRAKASGPLTVTAGAAKLRVAVKRSGIRKPKPQPKPVKGGLPGSFWWWNETSAFKPFDLYALRFYDNGYAYYRLPDDKDDTAPAKCTSVTAKPDEDGDYGTGCVRWSLEDGKLTTSDPKVTGTYRGGKLVITHAGYDDPVEADRLAEAQPGQRLNVSYLHRDSSGTCFPGQFCSTSTDRLTLQPDGQFGKTSESLTTSGGVGTPYVAVGSYPADARGTYEVLPGYRIRLSYANGTEKVFPFGLYTKGGPGYTEDGGLVLGQYNYYFEADD